MVIDEAVVKRKKIILSRSKNFHCISPEGSKVMHVQQLIFLETKVSVIQKSCGPRPIALNLCVASFIFVL